MNTSYAAGWDIGGANTKLALATLDGSIERVEVIPCELWRGLDRLSTVLGGAALPPPERVAAHAVTMTGELCDAFSDRGAGVTAIVGAVLEQLPGSAVRFFSTAGELLDGGQAVEAWQAVASANWMATAAFAAEQVNNGLLIDVGSTTTDIVPLIAGRAAPLGLTDAARLQQEELLYAGVLRTPVMALADRVPWDGAWSGVAAELFATSADVYCLTGDVDPLEHGTPAADGGEWTESGSARRLARQVGADFEPALLPALRALAQHIAERQRGRLADAIDLVASRRPGALPGVIVGAGAGRFLARQLAQRLGTPYRDFGDLPGMNGAAAAVAAPACVMALLAGRALARENGAC